MINIYLDIETIPAQGEAAKAAITVESALLKAQAAAPSNYKDAAKIAEYIAAKHAEIDAQADERWRKTALDGGRGHIVCICWAINDGPVQSVAWDPMGKPNVGMPVGMWCDEEEMLTAFFHELWGDLGMTRHSQPHWIGHNIRDFDLRFLFQRAVALGVKPPFGLPHDARPGSDRLYDTMTAWAGWGNRIKLDTLCQALGLPGKTDGIDGSKVWDAVAAGRIKDVVEYCRDDVEAVRRVHRRMTFMDRPLADEIGSEDAA